MEASISSEATTPTSTSASKDRSSLFYGINGHWAQGGPYSWIPLEKQKSALQDLGVTLYHQDVYNLSDAHYIKESAALMAPIKILPVLIPKDNASTEELAEVEASKFGAEVAKILKDIVPYYELGNEYDNKCIKGSGYAGNHRTDYNNDRYLIRRGLVRGLIEGIRSVDTSTELVGGSMAGWKHYGFGKMLWNGTTPNSETEDASKKVRWDITCWHWYDDMGEVTKAGETEKNRGVNTLEQLKTLFARPIMVTEFNTRPNNFTEAELAIRLTSMLDMWTKHAMTYDIVGINLYQLYSDREGSYGVFKRDGITKVDRYYSYKDFISKPQNNKQIQFE